MHMGGVADEKRPADAEAIGETGARTEVRWRLLRKPASSSGSLVEKLGTFRGEAKFTTWLTGITFNACRDMKRRRRSFLGLAEKLPVLAGLTSTPDGRGRSIWRCGIWPARPWGFRSPPSWAAGSVRTC